MYASLLNLCIVDHMPQAMQVTYTVVSIYTFALMCLPEKMPMSHSRIFIKCHSVKCLSRVSATSTICLHLIKRLISDEGYQLTDLPWLPSNDSQHSSVPQSPVASDPQLSPAWKGETCHTNHCWYCQDFLFIFLITNQITNWEGSNIFMCMTERFWLLFCCVSPLMTSSVSVYFKYNQR